MVSHMEQDFHTVLQDKQLGHLFLHLSIQRHSIQPILHNQKVQMGKRNTRLEDLTISCFHLVKSVPQSLIMQLLC